MLYKSVFSCVFLTLFSFIATAQDEYNYAGDWKIYSLNNWPISITKDSSVKRVDFTIERKNKIEKVYKTFNQKGKLTNYIAFDKQGKEKPFVNLVYDNQNNLTQATFYKKGGLDYILSSSYNASNKLLTEVKTNKRGKQVMKKSWSYTASGCIDSSLLYTKNTPKYKWKYMYYDACKKEKSVLYKRNKVVMVWRFDCKEEGEKLTKQKNTTQVCTWSKTSVDTLTRVYQTFNSNGEIEKQVYKYTVKDTLPLEWRVYDKNDILLRLHQYDKSYEKQIKYVFYKKGKPKFMAIREFDGNNLKTIHEYKKGKPYAKQTFTYRNNHIVQVTYFGKGNKKISTTTIAYN